MAYTTYRMDPYRQLANNILAIANQRQFFHIVAKTEVLVDDLLQFKQAHKYSFYTIFAKTVANVIEKDTRYRIFNSLIQKSIWRDKIIIPDDICCSIILEKQTLDGPKIAFYILHEIEKKSLAEIDSEIKARLKTSFEDHPNQSLMKWLLRLPSSLQRFIFSFLPYFPAFYKQRFGVIGLTNPAHSSISGGFSRFGRNAALMIGGIRECPWVIDGKIEIRKVMPVVMVFNHYIADARLAGDFLQEVKLSLEAFRN